MLHIGHARFDFRKRQGRRAQLTGFAFGDMSFLDDLMHYSPAIVQQQMVFPFSLVVANRRAAPELPRRAVGHAAPRGLIWTSPASR